MLKPVSCQCWTKYRYKNIFVLFFVRFCRGRNLMINFTDLLTRNEPLRYKMDVLKEGQIGGYCDFYDKRLNEQADHISPLQSWGPELRYFTRLSRRPIIEGDCDIVIDKPTFIMKIDASNKNFVILQLEIFYCVCFPFSCEYVSSFL